MRAGEAVRTLGGRYELTDEVARGGMGVVWRGRDTLLGRDVAVKEIFPRPGADAGADADERSRSRVLREARAAAALHHPGIVTVYDLLEEEDGSFIVMELLDAESVHEAVQANGPLEIDRAIGIGREVASALRVAHEHGITHRDVKPRNVLLVDDGRAKLADFGISSVKDDVSLTATGEVIGSPAFMSPEQAQGEPASPRTDLWGLGATLYFAVEGAPPFGEGEAIPTLNAVVHDEPRPMRRAGSLGPIVAGLLSKDPTARPTEEDLPRLFDEATAGTTTPTIADDARTPPLLIPEGSPTATQPDAPMGTRPLGEESPRRRSWVIPTALAGAIAIAAVIGIVAFGGGAAAPAKNGKGDSATLADHPVTRKHSAHETPAATTTPAAPATESPPPADSHGQGDAGESNGAAKGQDGGAPGNQHGEGNQGNGNGQGAQAAAPAPPPTTDESPEPSASSSPTKDAVD
jgi:serine/threonine protein kinase